MPVPSDRATPACTQENHNAVSSNLPTRNFPNADGPVRACRPARRESVQSRKRDATNGARQTANERFSPLMPRDHPNSQAFVVVRSKSCYSTAWPSRAAVLLLAVALALPDRARRCEGAQAAWDIRVVSTPARSRRPCFHARQREIQSPCAAAPATSGDSTPGTIAAVATTFVRRRRSARRYRELRC